MKKVLALVLAVMMLSTMAFAYNIGSAGGDPGDPTVEPGDSIKIYPDVFGLVDSGVTFSSNYFAITAKSFDKGKELVKEVKWNDKDECVEIVLKQDYEMTVPVTENLIIKEVKVKCKKDIKATDGTKVAIKNKIYTYDNTEKNFFIGYKLGEVSIDKENAADVEVTLGTGVTSGLKARNVGDVKLVKFVDDDYGTVNIKFGDVAYASGRVYKNNKAFLGGDEKVNVDLVKKYPDAELSFVNLHATFDGNMDFELYADEGSYVYALKDGVPVATNLKWDDDAYAFVGKVRTLGSYVISDTKLATGAAGSENPDTGANDVVGIATALAAVALVSAAAVSLKK